MPELPDVTVYVEALDRKVVGHRLEAVKLSSPFVLRSYDPPLDAVTGRTVEGIRRIGKRIVFDMGDALFIVIHLMIAGRLRWRAKGQKAGVGAKIILATFELDDGNLIFSEAGSKKRASITVVRGEAALKALDPGGIEPLEASAE
jgi:formamidopyrimidine-DNA glycosylase